MALWTTDYVILNQYSRPGTKLVGHRGIVLHWTADPGATDENEHNFFDGSDGGGGRYASAHIFVDRDSATLIIPLDEVAYHANEKPCRIPKLQATQGTYTGGANLTAIGVEMCVEQDGTIHPDTVTRTVQVVAELCRMYNNSIDDIYRHFDITGKNCPAPYVANPALFIDFKNRVAADLNGAAPAPAPAPTPQPVTPVVDQYKGSLVDYLKSKGEDSSFAHRAQLAAQNGIANYSGTAAQNVQLLALLLNSVKATPAPVTQPQPSNSKYPVEPVSTGNPIVAKVQVIVDTLNCRQHPDVNSPVLFVAKKGDVYNVTANINDWHEVIIDNDGHNGYLFGNNGQYLSLIRDSKPAPMSKYAGGNPNTNSVVDYLKSIGQDASFATRSRIAAELGIPNYSGSVAQNEVLLKKMRG